MQDRHEKSNELEILKQLQVLISELQLPDSEDEISTGTSRIPGNHLRINGYIELELKALARVLTDLKFNCEMKYKDTVPMLIIRPNSEMILPQGFDFIKTYENHKVEVDYELLLKRLQNYINSLKLTDANFKINKAKGTSKNQLHVTCASESELSALCSALKQFQVGCDLKQKEGVGILVLQPDPHLQLTRSFSNNFKPAYEKCLSEINEKPAEKWTASLQFYPSDTIEYSSAGHLRIGSFASGLLFSTETSLRIYGDLHDQLSKIDGLDLYSPDIGNCGIRLKKSYLGNQRLVNDVIAALDNLTSLDDNYSSQKISKMIISSIEELTAKANEEMQNRHDKSNELEILKQLQVLISELQLPNSVDEISTGTSNTPGNHLRITGYIELELKALARVLTDLKFNCEIKFKDIQRMLIIRPNSELLLPPGFNFIKTYENHKVEVNYELLLNRLQHYINSLKLTDANIKINEAEGSSINQLHVTCASESELSALSSALKQFQVSCDLKQKEGVGILVLQPDPHFQLTYSFSNNFKPAYIKFLSEINEKPAEKLTASLQFYPNDTIEYSSAGHLRIGDFTSGLMFSTKTSLRIYADLHGQLSKIDGLDLYSPDIGNCGIRLKKSHLGNQRLVNGVMAALDNLTSLDDNYSSQKISKLIISCIEELTGVKYAKTKVNENYFFQPVEAPVTSSAVKKEPVTQQNVFENPNSFLGL